MNTCVHLARQKQGEHAVDVIDAIFYYPFGLCTSNEDFCFICLLHSIVIRVKQTRRFEMFPCGLFCFFLKKINTCEIKNNYTHPSK